MQAVDPFVHFVSAKTLTSVYVHPPHVTAVSELFKPGARPGDAPAGIEICLRDGKTLLVEPDLPTVMKRLQQWWMDMRMQRLDDSRQLAQRR